ncbi:hypothetical protein CM15mP99_1620 [bacterium]|nr:MAG: hypothetical protein CM15mP99_1620 [bacterium]
MVYEEKKDIFQSFLDDIKSLSLKNHRILVGVSGGQDSSVLLHLCSMLPKKFHVFGLYVNHNLRNSAAIAEEKFVINKSKIYDIPIYIFRIASCKAKQSKHRNACKKNKILSV